MNPKKFHIKHKKIIVAVVVLLMVGIGLYIYKMKIKPSEEAASTNQFDKPDISEEIVVKPLVDTPNATVVLENKSDDAYI